MPIDLNHRQARKNHIAEQTASAIAVIDVDAKKITMREVNRPSNPPRVAYGNILWALLNSSDFMLNH